MELFQQPKNRAIGKPWAATISVLGFLFRQEPFHEADDYLPVPGLDPHYDVLYGRYQDLSAAVLPFFPMTLPRSSLATDSSITEVLSPTTSTTLTSSGRSTRAFAINSISSFMRYLREFWCRCRLLFSCPPATSRLRPLWRPSSRDALRYPSGPRPCQARSSRGRS